MIPINFIAFGSLVLGTICWLTVYILMIKKMNQDKTIALPLLPLSLNLSWEFIYGILYPSSFLPSAIADGLWLLLDVGVLYSFYKYTSKKMRVLPIILISFLSFWGILKVSEYYVKEGIIPKLYPLMLSGFIISAVIGIGMIYFIKKRKDSKGQSQKIAALMFLGVLFYVIEVVINPVHKPVQSFLLDVFMYGSLLSTGYYFFLLKKVIKNESVV